MAFDSGNIPQETLDYLASKKAAGVFGRTAPSGTPDQNGSGKKPHSGKSLGRRFLELTFLVGCAVTLVVVLVLIFGPSQQRLDAENAKLDAEHSAHVATLNQSGTASATAYNPAAIIADAKRDIAAKEFQSAVWEIAKLSAVDAQRPGVQSMLTRATHGTQLAALQEARSARIAYAEKYERSLLEEGGDYTVRAEGPNADILSVKYALINRPFVYKVENDQETNASWTSLGFKSVRLSDGFESSWSYKLK